MFTILSEIDFLELFFGESELSQRNKKYKWSLFDEIGSFNKALFNIFSKIFSNIFINFS